MNWKSATFYISMSVEKVRNKFNFNMFPDEFSSIWVKQQPLHLHGINKELPVQVRVHCNAWFLNTHQQKKHSNHHISERIGEQIEIETHSIDSRHTRIIERRNKKCTMRVISVIRRRKRTTRINEDISGRTHRMVTHLWKVWVVFFEPFGD